MYALARLDALVEKRLGGDKSRLLELFESREVFDLLRVASQRDDFYHFEPKTFDGDYLVETPDGFQVYWQERGIKAAVRNFTSLHKSPTPRRLSLKRPFKLSCNSFRNSDLRPSKSSLGSLSRRKPRQNTGTPTPAPPGPAGANHPSGLRARTAHPLLLPELHCRRTSETNGRTRQLGSSNQPRQPTLALP